MHEAALPKMRPKLAAASEDRWLVECLTLATLAALAYSQLMGANVLAALF